jgi:4-amino-4-deoxychorismate lyase
VRWLINGRPGNGISANDRGLAYGDGLFETIAIRDGRPRLIGRHLRRLTSGCERLSIPAPPGSVLVEEIASLSRGVARGTVKIVITRGEGPRGYGIVDGLAPTRLVGFQPQADPSARPAAEVVSCRTPSTINGALAGLKTLNRLDSVLARAELRASGADEGLMWDDRGQVSGGSMSNLFVVHQGRLLTPVLDRGGVRGVMRDEVLDVAAGLGLDVVECAVGREVLAEAGEAFLTNALVTIWPVRSLDGREFARGGIASALSRALAARGIAEAMP